ncbi:hypothetical protein ACWT_1114 [Actinoplanes sp. SE50]|uniref:maleylpyruvate isomerase N-terminal domain-containing protein n=1 Tax=unclassified Actinoplanes TaxID=2626549 RepID=UPI00023ECE0A|nr:MULTISPECIES: maleylpyruvate isomerase N-terminal domain-containing protein [unclassified Actinoplanes]AEV82130.1 hypothetical protein ACPL_1233 [Actinoplanes sp. SE50/110]ATO80529.1 hypothetical protein ACWT_1114 [Actinoplanes sp. SE50]SLL97935.1 putative Actinobacterial protein [Actinoplanes sp. SE50/110]
MTAPDGGAGFPGRVDASPSSTPRSDPAQPAAAAPPAADTPLAAAAPPAVIAPPALTVPVEPTAAAASVVISAFRAEADALGHVASRWTGEDWTRPTRCTPWNVRELFAHIRIVLAWLPGMLDAPAPGAADTSAAAYYRPDHRFSADTDATRIRLAQQHAPGLDVRAFRGFTADLADRCGTEPPGRVVRTRHGDAMLLTDFLITRVVELAVHGLDLADALARPAWLTPPAADVVLGLLFGRPASELPGPADGLLRQATGRAPAGLDLTGLRPLTLG